MKQCAMCVWHIEYQRQEDGKNDNTHKVELNSLW